MRLALWLLAVPASLSSAQQLTIHYEHSSQYEPNEFQLPAAIRALGDSIRQRITSGTAPRFSSVRDTTLEYSTPCALIKPPAIVQSSPAKFIQCQRALSGAAALTPILIVRKYGMSRPYYSALIVANKDADFSTIDDSRITAVYLADSTSTSGYVMPIRMFWSHGISLKPTLEGARSRFGSRLQVHNAQDPAAVEAKVQGDPHSIGAIGEYRTREEESARLDREGLKVLLRYELIPQGVIAVTADLLNDRNAIQSAINAFFRTDSAESARVFHLADSNARVVALSSLGITGVEPFTGEYKHAYDDLARVIDLVAGTWSVGPLNTESKAMSYAFQIAVGLVVLSLLYIAVLLTLRAKFYVRTNLPAARSDVVFYLTPLALGAAWFYLISHPDLLERWALFLIIVLSAAFGTAFRAAFRASVPSAEKRSVMQEAAAGLILAIVLSFVFFTTEDLVHNRNPFAGDAPQAQRYAIAVGVLSVGAAVLLDEAAAGVVNYFRRRFANPSQASDPTKAI